jgi:hypothetical protein
MMAGCMSSVMVNPAEYCSRRASHSGNPWGAAAGIGADQHPPPRGCGELGESSAGRGDVVGGGVRPGLAGAEHDGQPLPGSFRAVISKDSQGVEPVGFLPRRRGLLLIGVHGDDGGVDVDRISPPPVPGAASRASFQARSLAADRALPIAVSPRARPLRAA